MKECIKKLLVLVLVLSSVVSFIHDDGIEVNAEYLGYTPEFEINNYTLVNISDVFGSYQKTVDENIFYSLSQVNDRTLVKIFGDCNTPMFIKAKETINPLMALATTWGEAGSSYAGISLTTVMDFNPSTYVVDIDWINVTKNLAQVSSDWYYANARSSVNTNANGQAYKMPNALLQFPSEGSRETSAMTGLGVGPYQITSSDWNSWDLDCRINPVYGYENSLKKVGTNWINCGINPISDVTVYAALSLGHQGGGLISYDFGKNLINQINRKEVQDGFNRVAYQMYLDLLEKQSTKQCSLSNVNLNSYMNMLVKETGVNFGSYNGGPGRTNKGNYVALHVLRYCFYKYYYMGGYL